MSFAVHFVPADRVGQPVPPAATAEHEQLTADERATWQGLEPKLVALLGSQVHELAETPYAAQLVHEPLGLLVTWMHGDYQLSIPFWTGNANAATFELLGRIVRLIEDETGLVGIDSIEHRRFSDDPTAVSEDFAGIAQGYAGASDQQSLLGWLLHKLRR
ncbi:MAG: hypothetical protein HZY73_10440 [Micropruina sp.]|nr:MAG: hypothetical protein HZY73_10440 [Micropruina sp.]